MNPRTVALLRDVDLFLKLTGMKPTNFGRDAINDRGLMTKLRRGRKLWLDTEQRVRAYMDTYAQDAAA